MATQIEKFEILFQYLAILVKFKIPKLLAKTSGTFRKRWYEKVSIYFEASNNIFGKTNVPTHTAQLREVL